MHDRKSGKFPKREFACSVFYRLLVPKGGAKSIRHGEKSGSCLRFRPKRCADKLAPAFSTAHSPPVLLPAFSQCGDSCALRATMVICLRPYMAGLWPVGSHCENSGSSDGSGASARSDRAQTAQILRDRSASAGVVTRYFSRCLIFWCFWIKPKRKKNLREEKFLDRCFGKRPDPSIRRFLFAA